MATAVANSQAEFYREFLMSRDHSQPRDYGVNMEKVDLVDALAQDFNDIYRTTWTVDELLLHPREAQRFCDDVRHNRGWFDLPDDIILRWLLNRRKSP